MREDAPSLLRGEAQRRAGRVAAATVLFEELLEQEWQSGRAKLDILRGPDMRLHSFCGIDCHGDVLALLCFESQIINAQVSGVQFLLNLNPGDCRGRDGDPVGIYAGRVRKLLANSCYRCECLVWGRGDVIRKGFVLGGFRIIGLKGHCINEQLSGLREIALRQIRSTDVGENPIAMTRFHPVPLSGPKTLK